MTERKISSHQAHSRSPIWNKIGDFANIFKAFVGCNFLSLPFAFKQSGLILGIIGLILIAYITDHCCALIVKCKKAAIDQIMSTTFYPIHDDNSPEYRKVEKQKQKKRHALEMVMTYGDLGRLSMGELGCYIVNTALIITQFSFCVNYFIFMGDTITRMFPIAKKNMTQTSNDSSSSLLKATKHEHVGAPNVLLLMLVPFPFFMLQTFVRKMRNLAPLSAIANACVFLGFFAILAFLFDGLDFGNIHKVDLWKFSTFPIFFGQIVGAYEGIGTIIPIEASMNENRPNFPKYLHGAIFLISVILGSFGIFGYLHFTDGVDQLISDNLPYGTLSIVTQITLCIGILFTYPLQMFPVIEIVENFLFKETQERHTLTSSFNSEYSTLASDTNHLQYGTSGDRDDDESSEAQNSDKEDIEGTGEEMASITRLRVFIRNPSPCCDLGWSTWKRNILRTILVALSFGMAYLGRNYYAYITALSGSIGSSLLAFILPCLFHMILKKDMLPSYIVAKDILLMLFGVIAGIVGFVTTLIKMIDP